MMEEAAPAGERGCVRTLHLLLSFALNLKLLQKIESIFKKKKNIYNIYNLHMQSI